MKGRIKEGRIKEGRIKEGRIKERKGKFYLFIIYNIYVKYR